MKKLYLGCALRRGAAPHEFIANVLSFRARLEEQFHVLRFIDMDNHEPTSAEIFAHDMEQIRACDVVLAIVDEPSFGLGYEVSTALQRGKRVLMVAQADKAISPFPEGINCAGAMFKRYRDFDHLMEIVLEHLRPDST